ncbi:MAG: aspartate aminotransferase family protein [Lachnospiraceae bacterium]|nr:aspartate aminotransferase family protein [Lachnospiraceae bacterium]
MQQYIDQAEEYILHTYNRYQVVFDHGDGVNLYDTDGKEYLDFVSGIGVFALGYNNKKYNDAVKAQVDKILHTSNYYYNVPAAEAAKAVVEASGMDKVFFTNSGAEAVEGALKVARKYAYLKDGKTDHEIIAMQHSFHGRTFGALSVTGTDKYREPFGPMIGNIKFANMNDLDSVKALVTDKTCAIICETLQGEGGIHPATEEFLKGLRALCDETGALLILDEIQCGMGRTGYMYCWHKYGVKPDVMTTAKALGGGIPMGAFLMTKEVADNSLVAGDHGTTYGGNPLAGAACVEVFKLYEELNICENAKTVGAYLFDKLEEIKENYDEIIDHRGMGLMQGLEFNKPVADVINNALDNGLVLINAGTNIIRFLPPLIVTKEDVDRMIAVLKEAIENAH